MDNTILEDCLPSLGAELITEIKKFGTVKTYSKNDFIVKQGQFVRNLPIVLTGSVKVYSNEEDLQFLLYYIQQGESCIFSFAHLFSQDAINFSAIPEKKADILLLPIEKVKEWILRYPTFNKLVIGEFQKHYNELLEATKQIICYKLEDRLLTYLKNKSTVSNSKELPVSHKDIADDLGTSRVVISRLMKKLELDGKVFQDGRKIKML
ncbi:CRP/FNR family transcriptional regulator [Flavobacterium sp. 270]|uniref:Crp/Fnr family transcriptional regulator n=1 Tax=Flavobacterium sp. 270 TaxID=2512114 RepID=UPI0010660E24|nr:Crp/Fnr family transcriptional regulator [Flavobacterium sp. 270]TDW51659.1 CRP/FNR family transcriptional regulator [Flavobacterium sp. 270]